MARRRRTFGAEVALLLGHSLGLDLDLGLASESVLDHVGASSCG